MIIRYDNKKVRYPIHSIVLSNKGEIRYWFDDNGNIHTAVWNNDNCILADNEDKPINDIIKILVKDVAKHGYIEEKSWKNMETIASLRNDLYKAKRQRNHYSELLKEKNKYIKLLEEELKHFRDICCRGIKNDY